MLILGCGYVGEKLAKSFLVKGMKVTGTTRSETRAGVLRALGIDAVVVESPEFLSDELLQQCDALLDSIPLTRDESGMRASQLQWLPKITPKLSHLKWAGYLSTTGVYGDANGAWVDESFPCNPTSERGVERLKAEQAWLGSGLPAEVFRLAGIYGPERNIVSRLMSGNYRAVRWQPEHWSNRIHVDDIVATLMAAMKNPRAGRVVSVADDEPLSHADYVTELAQLIGAPLPQILSPEVGEKELSPTMLDFFRDSKRVSNRLMHDELLPELNYPTFRDAF
ncbi:MAG: SDR family NAD(P)-dependent oxidoreductase [Mariprofundaceae bacterium]|nr:SDR family NAD(P)-dependent oxidoreductase [Mariprofundaceae bacterium]